MKRKGLYLTVARFPSWAFICVEFKRTSRTLSREKKTKNGFSTIEMKKKKKNKGYFLLNKGLV